MQRQVLSHDMATLREVSWVVSLCKSCLGRTHRWLRPPGRCVSVHVNMECHLVVDTVSRRMVWMASCHDVHSLDNDKENRRWQTLCLRAGSYWSGCRAKMAAQSKGMCGASRIKLCWMSGPTTLFYFSSIFMISFISFFVPFSFKLVSWDAMCNSCRYNMHLKGQGQDLKHLTMHGHEHQAPT